MSQAEIIDTRRLAGFLALHLLLICVALTWGVHRLRGMTSERALPPARAEPLAIPPLYDDGEVISDEQLRGTLWRIGAPLRGREANIGQVDHALRFWGATADFENPDRVGGEEMRGLLTDHRRFAEWYGADQAPLLMDNGQGVLVRAFEGPASSSHVDHTLASLAEVATPLDFPVVTPLRTTTVRAMLEQTLRSFSLNQREYEWSTLAFALYLPPANRWTTSEGQEVSFDRLADRLMREALPNGVCSANHRLYSLVVFLRADDLMRAAGEPPILTPPGRQRIVAFLQGLTARFVRHQHPDGFWNGHWPVSTAASSEPSGGDGDMMSDRLIVTGHVLEWWALAPEEILPPRPVVVAAAQWLVRAVDRLTPEEITQYYTYLSHAGRALALWRGRLPGSVDLHAPTINTELADTELAK